MVEAGWAAVQPILDLWSALPPRDFPNYAAGTWGPEQANELLRHDGREWRNPTFPTPHHNGQPVPSIAGEAVPTIKP
jgi:hypothetical protein